jgi:hypothetical protein
MYLNEDVSYIVEYLSHKRDNIEGELAQWIARRPNFTSVMNISPRDVNERYKVLSRPINTYCKYDYIDNNYIVDKILQMSLPYSENRLYTDDTNTIYKPNHEEIYHSSTSSRANQFKENLNPNTTRPCYDPNNLALNYSISFTPRLQDDKAIDRDFLNEQGFALSRQPTFGLNYDDLELNWLLPSQKSFMLIKPIEYRSTEFEEDAVKNEFSLDVKKDTISSTNIFQRLRSRNLAIFDNGISDEGNLKKGISSVSELFNV